MEWISVKDRSPERNQLVLCVGAKGGMFLGTPAYSRAIIEETLMMDVPNSRGYRRATHWMPLPPPPKEVHGSS